MATAHYGYSPPIYLTTAADHNLGRSITAADVALATGSSPAVVQRDLLRFAHVVRARMRVMSGGELEYEIPVGYRNTLLQRSMSFRAITIWRSLWPYALGALKCAFGAMLFVSLAVSAAVISSSATSSSNRSEDKQKDPDRRRIRRNRSEYGTARVAINLADLVQLATRSTGCGNTAGGEGGSSSTQSVPFLESFFSFVFGDGDPNAG